jgi:2-polyprenyl-3-methyl-5-hydroxy-6-metoxy-1,4-benzoquinol methylase
MSEIACIVGAILIDSPPISLLDASFGHGVLVSRMLKAGYTAAGCDSSPTGIAIGQRALGTAARLKRLSVYDDLAAEFGGDWDVVVSTEVIEHLYEPRAFVRRACDLLKPGGHLILSTPYHGYLKNLGLAVAGGFDRHFTALWDGGHIKFWSYRTLTTLLRQLQFEDFRFSGAGRLPFLWKSMVISCRRGPKPAG